jgi:hypothetical protein
MACQDNRKDMRSSSISQRRVGDTAIRSLLSAMQVSRAVEAIFNPVFSTAVSSPYQF